MPHTTKCLAVFAVIAMVLGCGGEPAIEMPETFPVTGKVVGARDAAVSSANIDFRPASGDSLFIINATTNAEGEFELTTRHINDRKDQYKRPGVPAGEYRVTIMLPQPPDQQQGHVPPVTWPQPIIVKPEANHFTFDVRKAAAR